MKIVINEDDYGRVVRTPGVFNVYAVTIAYTHFPCGESSQLFVLNRENALRLQEDIRIWLKEHPE